MIVHRRIVCGVLLLGLFAAACRRGSSEEQTPRTPRWGAGAVIQAPAHLVPVQRRAPAERPSAQEVWRGLPASLKKDNKTRALLKKLLAAEEVELAALSGFPGSTFRPADGPFPSSKAFLALWSTKVRLEHDLGELPDFWTVGLGYAYFQGEPAREWQDGAGHIEVVRWVINDHLLRQDRGYLLIHGNIYGDQDVRKTVKRLVSQSPAELRTDLDRAIADFLKRHEP